MVKKSFGCSAISLPHSETQKWVDNGWLGKDGICAFPEDVQATLMDVRLKGLPTAFWQAADDAMIDEAVKAGQIVFVDGNGVPLTADAWRKKYAGYPDPVFLAKLLHKLPPGQKKFVKIGRC